MLLSIDVSKLDFLRAKHTFTSLFLLSWQYVLPREKNSQDNDSDKR